MGGYRSALYAPCSKYRQLYFDERGRGSLLFIMKLLRRYGAAVVVMAFDEQGQADTRE